MFKVGDRVVIKGTSCSNFYGHPLWGRVFEVTSSNTYWVGEYGGENNHNCAEDNLVLKDLYDTPLYKVMKED